MCFRVHALLYAKHLFYSFIPMGLLMRFCQDQKKMSCKYCYKSITTLSIAPMRTLLGTTTEAFWEDCECVHDIAACESCHRSPMFMLWFPLLLTALPQDRVLRLTSFPSMPIPCIPRTSIDALLSHLFHLLLGF